MSHHRRPSPEQPCEGPSRRGIEREGAAILDDHEVSAGEGRLEGGLIQLGVRVRSESGHQVIDGTGASHADNACTQQLESRHPLRRLYRDPVGASEAVGHDGDATRQGDRPRGPADPRTPHIRTVSAGSVRRVADDVVLERRGAVGRLVINRPERRNALNSSVLEGLRFGLAELKEDPSIRVVVLTGSGEQAFSAGADLVGPSSPAAGGAPGGPSAAELHEGRGELAALFQDLWDLGKPSIARVRGYALAGGMGVALACDLVVAGTDAVFGTPEIDIGIWPYMVTVSLLRSMAPKRALELMMTGRRVTASEGAELGFVNRVVPVAELDDAVDELALLLSKKPPAALRAGRASFYRVLDMAAGDALAYLHPLLTVATGTSEAEEGRAAFAAKRPPSWSA